MSFGLDPGKLGFKLGDVLVGLKSGTTDVPETITSDQGKLHTLGYLWNPDTLAYQLPTINADGGIQVHVTNPAGGSGGGLTNAELRAAEVPVADDASRNLLWRMLNVLMSPKAWDSLLNRIRGTVILESGTVTTVTNAVPVGNVATLDGQKGSVVINSLDHTAWALNVRARIT